MPPNKALQTGKVNLSCLYTFAKATPDCQTAGLLSHCPTEPHLHLAGPGQ